MPVHTTYCIAVFMSQLQFRRMTASESNDVAVIFCSIILLYRIPSGYAALAEVGYILPHVSKLPAVPAGMSQEATQTHTHTAM